MGALIVLPAGVVLGWDLDNDELSDVYARIHNLPAGSANADTDGDGRSNADEARAGTNPCDGSAAGIFAAAVTPAGGSVGVSWIGITGKRYQVQRSETLATWTDTGTTHTGADATLVHTEPASAFRHFRIKVLASLDTDGDSFDDWEEAKLLGTNPAVKDGDTDGLSDAFEQFYFGNLLRTGDDDADGDLILAKDEHTFGLDPLADDTASGSSRSAFTYTGNDELATYSPPVGVATTYQPDAEGNLAP